MPVSQQGELKLWQRRTTARQLATWFGWLSLAVFTGMSAILILQRVFGISLL